MMHPRHRRREFLGLLGGGLAALPALCAEGPEADLVVFNAKVYTVDPRMPKVEAFAVKNGRFSAMGSNAEMRALASKGTQTLDAKGMTIVPGFIDTHNHATGTVLVYEVLVGNPYEVEFVTIDSIVEKLRVKAQATPPGMWVEGFFFDDTKVKDGRMLICTISIGCRRIIRWWCIIAAAIPGSTTAKRWRWRTSTRTRRTPRAAHSIAMRMAI